MKLIIGSISALFFIVFSLNAAAERFVLTGKPVELVTHGAFYSFPSTYTARRDYHFVTLSGMERVCFLKKMAEFSSLNRLEIILENEGKKLEWNCYAYDPQFFEIDF